MRLVTVWISAFIPRDVLGYTVQLTKGVHAGKTAIPLPGIARTWPGNTFKDWNAGYLTDQRDFSPKMDASARMHSQAEVDISGIGPALIKQTHWTSGTTEVNLVSGDQTGFAYADMSRCYFTEAPAFSITPSPPSGPTALPTADGVSGSGAVMPTTKFVAIKLKAAAGDPLVGMAADIDYLGTFTFSVDAGDRINVNFSGKVDAFPAYDCYASVNGAIKTLFILPPPTGNTVADLLGPANTPVSGKCIFP